MEDHLSRCAACRTSMAEMKGDRRVIAMPQRSSSRRMRWGALAAAPRWSCRSCMSAAAPSMAGWPRAARGPRSSPPPAACTASPACPPKREARRREARSKQAPSSANGSWSARPGGARRAAPRRRIDGGCQRAHGAVRDHRLERPCDSPPARRRHRQGRRAAPRPPARPDAGLDRLRQGNRLRRVHRHGRLGRVGRRGVRRGEPARHGGPPQPRPAGRLQPGARHVGRGSHLLEPRRGRVPAAARLVREDRAPAGGDVPGICAPALPCCRTFRQGPSSTGPSPTSAGRSARPWCWRSSRRPRTRRSAPGGTPRRGWNCDRSSTACSR
jgi:hypothetical protein